MELLYEKEAEFMNLKERIITNMYGNFTLGYALQKGFNNLYLKMPDGSRMEIGYLTRVGDHLEYSGCCTDFQLMKLAKKEEIFEDGDGYTCLLVKLVHDEDYSIFKKEGE